jgi:CHAD domain-containing protein
MNGGPTLATTAATVGPYVIAKLRALDGRLSEVAPRVMAGAIDDDAVHDLRVALRRTRTMLEVARRVLGRYPADEVRRALRDLQRATGALRDEEVLREIVGSLGSTRLDVAEWLKARARRERRLRGVLARTIRSGGLEQGRMLLEALLAFRIKPSRERRLTKFARRSVETARRGVEHHRGARLDDPQALHRLRIAYKRLRYTLEMFAEALPSQMTGFAQTAARFQARLGDLHDVDMAIGCVRRARTLSSETRLELLTRLDELRRDRALAYAKERGGPASDPGDLERGGVHRAGGASLRKISSR